MEYGAPALVEQISAERVPPGAVALWWLGQASFAIKGAGVVVYVDPYLQHSPARMTPSPFAPDTVTNADVVVLTHDHLDHIDPLALPGIAKASPKARFVAPHPKAGRVGDLVGHDRVVPATADEPLRFGALELLPAPAKHEEFELTGDGYPYLGYSIRLDGVTVHHTGDTIPFEGQVERIKQHQVDVLLVPINGRDFYRTRAGTIGNMDYREAADYAVQIGARLAIPMHYGMFRGNTVPPGHFVSHLADFYPEQATHVMGRYGKFVYVKS